MNMSQWTPICQVEDIPVLGSRRVAREQGLDTAARHRLSELLVEKRNLVSRSKVSDL